MGDNRERRLKQKNISDAGTAHNVDEERLRYGRMPSSTGVERRTGSMHSEADGYSRLTGRERWIVSELIRHRGAPNKVIAYALQISPNTLRNHLASIYNKLGVRRRVELVVYALERGLDALPEGKAQRSTSGGR